VILKHDGRLGRPTTTEAEWQLPVIRVLPIRQFAFSEAEGERGVARRVVESGSPRTRARTITVQERRAKGDWGEGRSGTAPYHDDSCKAVRLFDGRNPISANLINVFRPGGTALIVAWHEVPGNLEKRPTKEPSRRVRYDRCNQRLLVERRNVRRVSVLLKES
jgi:hypothetical protein